MPTGFALFDPLDIFAPMGPALPVSAYRSNHFLCLEFIQTTIRSLSLPDITNENVVITKFPELDRMIDDALVTGYPFIAICPWGTERMSKTEGTNLRDDVGYPCLVVFVDANDQSLVKDLERNLIWRERTHKSLRFQQNLTLPDEDSPLICIPEPNMIAIPAAWAVRSIWEGGTVFRFQIREMRGVNA